MLFMAFLVTLAPLAQADSLLASQASALLQPQIQIDTQH
jgi:hypothetical protein